MRFLPAAFLAQLSFSGLTTNNNINVNVNGGGITTKDDVVLFDAPAFANPTTEPITLASFEAFVFDRQVNTAPAVIVIMALLASFGIVGVGHSMENLVDRAKLFAAEGLQGKSIGVNVQGCAPQALLSTTAAPPDAGLFYRNVSLGVCDTTVVKPVTTAEVALTASDPRTISADVFFYSDSGFGVISDVDDTIKITNVLNRRAMLKATFLDDPVPVAGMPELYASLAETLTPDFFYVSGSMMQIYPFLRNFIRTTYSASKGPLFLRNLTDIHNIIKFIDSNGVFNYKLAVIDQIKGTLPNKRFLAIGDSTEKDPETYGEAFRKYGDFITCAWIREVDGANNTPARFSASFAGMPANRWRTFKDSEIPDLARIKVAAGEC